MQQPLYICFVDFKKAFDSVSHDKLWVTMMDMVSLLGSGAVRPGFKSQPRRCRVTVLGKLFTPIEPLFTKQ